LAKSARGLSLSCADPPHVLVTANDSTVVALDTVTFTAQVFSSGVQVSAVGWRWVPTLGSAWDPWTQACSGVALTCRIAIHGSGDMYYAVVDDANQQISGSVHVFASVPDDVGEDTPSGDAPLPTNWDTGGTSATPVDELHSKLILAAGVLSGHWTYTQACAQCSGGCVTCDHGLSAELPLDYPNHVGDCTDFVWVAIHNTLGSAWQHDKMSTSMYTSDTTNLAAHGFVEVDSASVRPGDAVVRTWIGGSGHAGLFVGWVAGAGAAGWANNGSPATDTTKNSPKPTGAFLFAQRPNKVVKFFRPQM